MSNSRIIRFPVYYFKSRNPRPKPDPIVYTVGGPGSSTMPSAQYMKFYKYLDDRDFILVEQRGTPFAEPSLDCPEWSQASFIGKEIEDEKVRDSLEMAAAHACRERLLSTGIDLNGYHTIEIAADIHDLITALKIKEYNLLTISYSTKIAQVLLRDYPEGIRSVVMDSPLPLEVNYEEESISNLYSAMDRMFADCNENPDCATAYPNLKARFYAFLRHTTKNPIRIELSAKEPRKPEVFHLKGEDFISVFTKAGTSEIPEIPLQMNKLLEGDYGVIKDYLESARAGPGDGSGIGMRLCVWCAEELPFVSNAGIRKEIRRFPETQGLTPVVFSKDICKIWNVRKMAKRENRPVRSDIPVLLINGSYDNETPPHWAAAMKENLTQSYHLVFPGWSHTPTTYWSNTCGMEAAREFFNNPTKKPLLDCHTTIAAPIFYTQENTKAIKR